ncbi:hypothetical protein JKP88DRAFT_247323 [Tribonema minus]|uniref:Uncharacterized protein n=1 Tax=Tribonema minus TaxID=303371 RepID=A0A835YRU5_9STRA|nr:hypothetical protein JKP88DRAFT_247323 [Tribonema minus]
MSPCSTTAQARHWNKQLMVHGDRMYNIPPILSSSSSTQLMVDASGIMPLPPRTTAANGYFGDRIAASMASGDDCFNGGNWYDGSTAAAAAGNNGYLSGKADASASATNAYFVGSAADNMPLMPVARDLPNVSMISGADFRGGSTCAYAISDCLRVCVPPIVQQQRCARAQGGDAVAHAWFIKTALSTSSPCVIYQDGVVNFKHHAAVVLALTSLRKSHSGAVRSCRLQLSMHHHQ